MKKLFTQIVKKNGELKDVYVCVDDETARVLEQVDEETRHTTTLRCLKDRYTGLAAGQTVSIKYNKDTGRLQETTHTNDFDLDDGEY